MIKKWVLVVMMVISSNVHAMKTKDASMEAKQVTQSLASEAEGKASQAAVTFSEVVLQHKDLYTTAGIITDREVVRFALKQLEEFIQDGMWAYGKHSVVKLRGQVLFTALLKNYGLNQEAINTMYRVGENYRKNKHDEVLEASHRLAWHQVAVPLREVHAKLYDEFAQKYSIQESDNLKAVSLQGVIKLSRE